MGRSVNMRFHQKYGTSTIKRGQGSVVVLLQDVFVEWSRSITVHRAKYVSVGIEQHNAKFYVALSGMTRNANLVLFRSSSTRTVFTLCSALHRHRNSALSRTCGKRLNVGP